MAGRTRNLINGTDAAESIYGTAGDDVIRGLGGDDQIYGQGGNDKLDGGAGNDFLKGGAGSDTYFLGWGSGQDVVSDVGGAMTDIDKVVLGAGVTTDDVFVHASGDDLYLVVGSTDRIIFTDYFHDPENQKDRLQFADGTVWKYADVVSYLDSSPFSDIFNATPFDDVRHGRGGSDVFYGMSGNDKLYGDAGDDGLYGDDGNDRLDGGVGNDHLHGGDGSDTYVYGPGSGQDSIFNWNSQASFSDKILVTGHVDPDEVILSRSGDTLTLTIAGTADTLTIWAHFANDEYSIDRIQFEDGTIWNEGFILEAVGLAKTPESGLF